MTGFVGNQVVLPNGGPQLRRAIRIRAARKQDYLRSMLSRRQRQGFVGRGVEKICLSQSLIKHHGS
jgi:hypothetical protein